MNNLLQNATFWISAHTYETIFVMFLFILFLFTVYSVYFLFFEMPKVKGKKNQDFVSNEVAQFSEYYKQLLKQEFDKLAASQRENMDKTSQDIVSGYKNLVADEADKTRKSINVIFEDVKAGVISQMEQLKKDLGAGQMDLKKVIEEKLIQSLGKADSEIEVYKKAKLKKLDDGILDIVKHVTEEVLSKSLNTNEHKQLIFDCLEKAKREGIFNE